MKTIKELETKIKPLEEGHVLTPLFDSPQMRLQRLIIEKQTLKDVIKLIEESPIHWATKKHLIEKIEGKEQEK